ncbi:uncharacterized protein LOC115325075 [Ixodes scapularis]|uniref:uncharacterized protein LOC115325075 n=1 Tax=Ixodes scapularis TaxID=6945 RepID=UPI001A9DA442|nr:uncharacterized protein LOC115325075 [Ixodes scapularis]
MADESRSYSSLSMKTILDFLDCTVESRCYVEAERLLDAKHLVLVGAKQRKGSDLKIVSLCQQTSGLQAHPHVISTQFANVRGDIQIVESECTCKAGKSEKCKHSSATLIHCYRASLASLDVLSCTDIECEWSAKKKGVQHMYEAVALSKFCHVSMEPPVVVTAHEQGVMAELLLQAAPQSAIAQQR